MAEQETSAQTIQDFSGSKDIQKISRLSVCSTYELIRDVAVRDSERTAVVLPAGGEQADQLGRAFSYGALLNGIHQTANLLADLAVESGDVIALLVPNLLEAHLLLWGGQTVGTVCPVPLGLPVEQIIALLREVNAKVLVAPGREASQDLWQKAEEIRRDVKSITVALQVRGPGKERDAVYAFNALLGDYSASHVHIRRDIFPDDMAVFWPISSPTGMPSFVSLTHGDLLYLARAIGTILRLAPEDVLLRGLLYFL
jgi:fatty-acyl-CoA synthase